MTGSFLLFGFLLGVKHALEADHVAAVASLATRSAHLRDNVKLAAAWGAGHAAVLVFAGTVVIAFGLTLPGDLARSFEGFVGLILIALGADVLRRLRRTHVHLHAHRHGDGTLHLHVHSHIPEAGNGEPPPHEHRHVPASRALVVGGIHGLAGSAALVLLAIERAPSAAGALACLVAFGAGSVAGMMLFSVVISLPLRLSAARRLAPLARGIAGALGTTTVALGCWIVFMALLGS